MWVENRTHSGPGLSHPLDHIFGITVSQCDTLCSWISWFKCCVLFAQISSILHCNAFFLTDLTMWFWHTQCCHFLLYTLCLPFFWCCVSHHQASGSPTFTLFYLHSWFVPILREIYGFLAAKCSTMKLAQLKLSNSSVWCWIGRIGFLEMFWGFFAEKEIAACCSWKWC